jgi:flagellar assembly protein FliH
MPSSPDAAPAVVAWQPGELRVGSAPAAPSPAGNLSLFEVAAAAAVPDDLLADARAAARAEGYSAGWAAGMRAAGERAAAEAAERQADHDRLLAEARDELRRAVGALDAAAAALEQRVLPTTAELETLLLESAFGVAEALVGAALRDDATRAPAALARVLALAPEGEPLTVRLHPADHALLTADADLLGTVGRTVTLVADPALAPGDALASAGATEIDARIRDGVARVREVLVR